MKIKASQLIKNIFVWIATRTLVVLIFIGFLANLFVDSDKIEHGQLIRGMHYLKAESFQPMVPVMMEGQPFPKESLEEFLFFYQKATEYMPQNAAGFSLLGFCYYHKQEFDKSAAAFEAAINLKPDVFWFYYDLGLIYYKQHQFDAAIAVLKKAWEQDPEATMLFIQKAVRFYHPIVRALNLKAQGARKRLKEGYRDVFYMVLRSQEYQKQYHEMIQTARSAIQANVGTAWLFVYFAGRAYFQLENYDMAYKHFAETIRLKPDFPDPYRLAAQSAKMLGNVPSEIQLRQQWEILQEKQKAFEDAFFPHLSVKVF